MNIQYKLKLFHSFFQKYCDVKDGPPVKTTFDENDIQEFDFDNISIRGYAALVTYVNGIFECADGVIIENIRGNEIYLDNGQHFDKNGNLIE